MDRVHESRVLGPLKPIRPHHRHNYNGWYAYSYKFSCLSVYLSTYLPTLCGYLSIYLSSSLVQLPEVTKDGKETRSSSSARRPEALLGLGGFRLTAGLVD